jgi:hypothetical protein
MTLRDRAGWIGHPLTLACAVILVVNDHWAKDSHPGVVTGKLSDVVGLVVIGVASAVMLGRLVGIAAAGVGFIALKTVPGVAEAAAPVLGGVTLRDHTDLAALPALLGVVWLTRRPVQPPRTLLVVGGVVAIGAVTATSAAPPWDVNLLGTTSQGVLAQTRDGNYVSSDGGVSWSPSSSADVPTVPPVATACTASGTCFRVTADHRKIERKDPGGPWTPDLEVTPAMVRTDYAVPAYQPDRKMASLSNVVTTRVEGRDVVIADFGLRGVLVRGPQGTWTRHAVGPEPPVVASRVAKVLSALVIPIVILWWVAIVLVWRPRRWFWGALLLGLPVLVPAWGMVIVALRFVSEGERDPANVGAVVAVVLLVLATVTVVAARFLRPDRGVVVPDRAPSAVPPF